MNASDGVQKVVSLVNDDSAAPQPDAQGLSSGGMEEGLVGQHYQLCMCACVCVCVCVRKRRGEREGGREGGREREEREGGKGREKEKICSVGMRCMCV